MKSKTFIVVHLISAAHTRQYYNKILDVLAVAVLNVVHVFSTFTRHRRVYTTCIVVRRRFHLMMKPIECILNSTKCVHLKCWFIQAIARSLSRARSDSSVLCSSLNMTMLFFFRVVVIVKHYYLVDSSCIDWLTDWLTCCLFISRLFSSLLIAVVCHR